MEHRSRRNVREILSAVIWLTDGDDAALRTGRGGSRKGGQRKRHASANGDGRPCVPATTFDCSRLRALVQPAGAARFVSTTLSGILKGESAIQRDTTLFLDWKERGE